MTRGPVTQTRSFVYDSAGRLTSATNPENGTVYYYYNSSNTLQYKHNARGQDTVYTYDSQNRVLEIQRYPQGKNNQEDTCQRVNYTYDTNPLNGAYSQAGTGRLTTAQYNLCVAAANPTSFAEMYSYHPAGAVIAKRLAVTRTEYSSTGYPAATPTANLDVTYTYTAAGLVSTVAYPTYPAYNGNPLVPTTFTYGYDAMSRPVSLQDDGTQGANPAVDGAAGGGGVSGVQCAGQQRFGDGHGDVFLSSGGQGDDQASAHLQALVQQR